MFAKKFLSLISVLFMLSQFFDKANAEINISTCTGKTTETSCDGSTPSENPTSYCVQISDKTIYGLDGNGDALCKFVLTPSSVNILKIDGKTVETLNTSDINSDLGKVAIINCNDSNCVQTQGIIKDGTGAYYSITPAENASINDSTYKSVTACTDNSGKLATITREGASPGVEICLSSSKSTPLATGTTYNFLLEDTSLNALTITLTGENSAATNRVLKVGTNYFVFDALYTTEEKLFCANEDNKLESRLVNQCTSAECEKYYVCANGSCDEKSTNYQSCSNGTCIPAGETCPSTSTCDPAGNATAQSQCNAGYYLKTNKLYLCTQSSTGRKRNTIACKEVGKEAGQTGTKVPIGYLKNAEQGATETYIQCTYEGTCTAINPSSSCTGAGVLYTDSSSGSALTLCLEADTPVSTSIADEGSYFVNVSSKNTFGEKTDHYVIVKIEDENVILQLQAEASNRFEYTTTNYLITSRSDAKTPTTGICTTGMHEFMKNDCDNCVSDDAFYYTRTTTTPETPSA